MKTFWLVIAVAVVAGVTGAFLSSHYTNRSATSSPVFVDVTRVESLFAGGETVRLCAESYRPVERMSISFVNAKTGKPAGHMTKVSASTATYCVRYASPARPQTVRVTAGIDGSYATYLLPVTPQPPRP